jgi:hypothetical protein
MKVRATLVLTFQAKSLEQAALSWTTSLRAHANGTTSTWGALRSSLHRAIEW